MEEYFKTYPNSKGIEMYKDILKLVSNQHFIPPHLHVYDLEHNYKTHVNEELSYRKEYEMFYYYNQQLTITFRWNQLFVVCKQNMWFYDAEHTKVIENSQNYENYYRIEFFFTQPNDDEDELEDKLITDDKLNKEDLKVLFTWLHEFLMQTYHYDPFNARYFKDDIDITTSYQDYIPSF
jgi:hypothetical protein